MRLVLSAACSRHFLTASLHRLIAAGQKKAEEASGTTADDLKAKTDDAASSLDKKVEESKAGTNVRFPASSLQQYDR